MRKDLLILFLMAYSTAATLGNQGLCQDIPGCSQVQAMLDSHHEYMQTKRTGFINFVRRVQSMDAIQP